MMERKRRILFVDDEANVLSGLRRMLRRMRNEWEMAFAESGAEALEMLNRRRFDVVVSDMRMPGMDGAQLLALVQRHFPKTVRIVLSGQSDQKLILKSVRSAHQYLTKPCDSESLIDTVVKSCRLRDLLHSESLKKIVSRTEFLPSLPSLYTELMEEINSADGSIRRVGEIIERDLAMSSKILQLVNSSFFGFPRHIESPSRAVTLLGQDTVKSLVLTAGIFAAFSPSALASLDVESLFQHSLKTGAIARGISRIEGLATDAVDDAFMGGLLHDLGKLVFAANFPDTSREVMVLSRNEGLAAHQMEMERFGATHAEVGAYLLGLWGLPDNIVEAVADHHRPKMLPENQFCVQTAIYAANLLHHHRCEKAPTPAGLAPDRTATNLEPMQAFERWAQWHQLCERIEYGEHGHEQLNSGR